MPVKVLVTAKYFCTLTDAGTQMLDRAGLEVVFPRSEKFPLSEERLIQWGKDAEAIIAGTDRFTAEVLGNLPRLKIISRFGVGVNSIDMAAARARGVTVGVTPGANHSAVADHVFALALAVARQVPSQDAAIRAGQWTRPDDVGWELGGKTLGILGLGRIGRAVAKRARGFDMRILGLDPYVGPEQLREDGLNPASIILAPLEQILEESDILTLHTPLEAGTRKLIGREELARMKPTAVLINTSRGEIIDQEALHGALVQGVIAAAGLDVFHPEPPVNEMIVKLPNVVSTMHVAGLTRESVVAMSRLAADNVIRLLGGDPPLHTAD